MIYQIISIIKLVTSYYTILKKSDFKICWKCHENKGKNFFSPCQEGKINVATLNGELATLKVVDLA